MAQLAKKKKRNINRELRVGGCIAIFTSPLIVLAFVLGIYGFLIALERFISNSSLNYTPPVSLSMMVGFGVLCLILMGTGYKFIQRFRALIQVQQHLKTEQERVAQLVDTSSAVDRLKDRDLSHAIQQESPTEKSNRGYESSF